MATRDKDTVSMPWLELSGLLSKASVLLPDEDITDITLVQPHQLLLHTARPEKRKEAQNA